MFDRNAISLGYRPKGEKRNFVLDVHYNAVN